MPGPIYGDFMFLDGIQDRPWIEGPEDDRILKVRKSEAYPGRPPDGADHPFSLLNITPRQSKGWCFTEG
jgi:hypothetical protein